MDLKIYVLTFTELRNCVIKKEAGQKVVKCGGEEVPTGIETKEFISQFSQFLLIERCNYIYDMEWYKENLRYSKETLLYFDAIPTTTADVFHKSS